MISIFKHNYPNITKQQDNKHITSIWQISKYKPFCEEKTLWPIAKHKKSITYNTKSLLNTLFWKKW